MNACPNCKGLLVEDFDDDNYSINQRSIGQYCPGCGWSSDSEQPVQKYEKGQRVWFYANFVRVEGEIEKTEIRNGAVFYQVGADLVPQEHLLPVE